MFCYTVSAAGANPLPFSSCIARGCANTSKYEWAFLASASQVSSPANAYFQQQAPDLIFDFFWLENVPLLQSFPRSRRIFHCLAISVIISKSKTQKKSKTKKIVLLPLLQVASGKLPAACCLLPAALLTRPGQLCAARQVVKSMKMHKCKRTRLMVNMVMVMAPLMYDMWPGQLWPSSKQPAASRQ